jgi:hypothetical protein
MRLDITSMAPGGKPSGFTEGLTGQGNPVRWQVLEDASAPGGKVIAETSQDTADYRFPLCIYDAFTGRDVETSVRFRAVDGTVDQAAGLIVRVQDAQNYYVARANALEVATPLGLFGRGSCDGRWCQTRHSVCQPHAGDSEHKCGGRGAKPEFTIEHVTLRLIGRGSGCSSSFNAVLGQDRAPKADTDRRHDPRGDPKIYRPAD